MRTNVTLADDVAAKPRDEMTRTGTVNAVNPLAPGPTAKPRDEMTRIGFSMKDVVNKLLLGGIETRGEQELAASFTVDARPMGARVGFDIDDIGGLLDLLDILPDDE